MSRNTSSIFVVGSALWDVIAIASSQMTEFADIPGRIKRRPGGVALNIALALSKTMHSPTLFSAIGKDIEGTNLIEFCNDNHVKTDCLTMVAASTDQYLAIEHPDGVVFGAIADCHTLEKYASAVYIDVKKAVTAAKDMWQTQYLIIDGNLPTDILSEMLHDPVFEACDIYIVPASPGKAKRLLSALNGANATLIINKVEAEILLGSKFKTSEAASMALFENGVKTSIVTDGPHLTSLCCSDSLITAHPPKVRSLSTTGAGDYFVASFITSKIQGNDDRHSLNYAVAEAANFTTGSYDV